MCVLSCVSASGAAKTTADDLPADVDTKRRKVLRPCAGAAVKPGADGYEAESELVPSCSDWLAAVEDGDEESLEAFLEKILDEEMVVSPLEPPPCSLAEVSVPTCFGGAGSGGILDAEKLSCPPVAHDAVISVLSEELCVAKKALDARDGRVRRFEKELLGLNWQAILANRPLESLRKQHEKALELVEREDAILDKTVTNHFGTRTGHERQAGVVKWAEALLAERVAVQQQMGVVGEAERLLVEEELRLIQAKISEKCVERIHADILRRREAYRVAKEECECVLAPIKAILVQIGECESRAATMKDLVARAVGFRDESRALVASLDGRLRGAQRARAAANRAIALARRGRRGA
jgi:hypothetical protein